MVVVSRFSKSTFQLAQARQTSAVQGGEHQIGADRLLNAFPFTCNAPTKIACCSNQKQTAIMSAKTCFVTIGATASFSALVEAALKSDFVKALEGQGYTDLIVQYGEGGKEVYEEALKKLGNAGKVKISGFDLDKGGLGRYMRQAKAVGASNKDSNEGVVISHAGEIDRMTVTFTTNRSQLTGSGTILDALRISVPIIVVPNPDLLDNHQVELAETLSEQEYVVHGKLNDLPKALRDSEALRQRQKQWPPPNSRETKGLRTVIDEEMGYLD